MDDPLGPLGGALGGLPADAAPGPEAPPAPPQKEAQLPTASGSSLPGMMDSVNLDEDEDEDEDRPLARGPRLPPPVQPPVAAALQRQTQPSVSVEQAAKPTFSIYVGDPHKVGDLTSSHTEYSVFTKVSAP